MGGDDAAGAARGRMVRERVRRGRRDRARSEPTALLDASGRARRSRSSWTRPRARASRARCACSTPPHERLPARPRGTSTHAFGLAEAIELGCAWAAAQPPAGGGHRRQSFSAGARPTPQSQAARAGADRSSAAVTRPGGIRPAPPARRARSRATADQRGGPALTGSTQRRAAAVDQPIPNEKSPAAVRPTELRAAPRSSAARHAAQAARHEVCHRGVVTVQAEDDLAVIAGDRHADRVVGEDRDQRDHPPHRRAERIERRLGTGNVRDRHVEEARGEGEPRQGRVQRRWHDARNVHQRLGSCRRGRCASAPRWTRPSPGSARAGRPRPRAVPRTASSHGSRAPSSRPPGAR